MRTPARAGDVAKLYSHHLEVWQGLCADAETMAAGACLRSEYLGLLREIRGQAALLLHLAAALERTEAAAPKRPEVDRFTAFQTSRWTGILK